MEEVTGVSFSVSSSSWRPLS